MVLEGFRISPQQSRIWSLQRSGRHPAGGNRCAVRIQGELDRAALTAAWKSLVERHEILRTQIHLLAGLDLPVQVLSGDGARWLPDRDVSAVAPVPVAELLDELGREPLADDRGPSAVLSLLRLSGREHMLLLALPAFQSDAVGLRNTAADLARCYAAIVEGRSLEDEPLPYTGAADWLLDLLESEEAEAGKKHWSRVDLSPLAELRLPREERPSSGSDPAPAGAIAVVALELGPDRTARLDEVAGRLRVAPETFLLACWQAFLAGATRQAQGLVGVTFPGRTDEELEAALGLFARVLPVSWRIDPETPLSAVAQTLATELDEARQWQECFTWKPLERAIDKLGAEPFFPYTFEAVSLAGRFPAAGVTFSVEHLYSCTDRFSLRLFAVRRPEGLRLEIQHDRTRFGPAEAGRWASRFATFLGSALASPGAAVDDLEMVSAGEREHLLRDYNRTATELPLDRCLHEHFEAQVERSPGQVAVELAGVELSYAELNARANRLAHCLREQGAGPESLVGICLDRSIEMVVALLGVLKAGAAWLPLDPDYPAERLAFMLEDARPRALLTRSGTRDDIAAQAERVLFLDRMEAELARYPAGNPEPWTGSGALAYMIYTSGSTGRPKGVMVPHRAIANRLLWMLERFPLAADDRVLLKTPFSFDASIWEIFVPLFAGARLVVSRPGSHRDPSDLVRTVIDRGITVLQLVPSLLRVVLDEPGFAACRSLRRVFSGGEALTGDLVERFYAAGLAAELHNLYGPTEVAIDATCWSCRRDEAPGVVPIGYPIANAEVYLLDAAGRVVPEGMGGELHVGGAGLARGYHRRPELTAERLLPDACSSRRGDRLYRTGDLARYRDGGEDGSLEFLGRIDDQMKVRGFRIEPGEIEARLRSHPRVQESAVVARRDEQGGARLVAYVVPRHRAEGEAPGWTEELTPDRLRSFLGARLPEHMVPAVFVLVDGLPLTPNGKVDRKALAERPLPGAEQRPGARRVAPASAAERVLAAIWRDLLRLDEVSAADNFFELGGDSILSIQMIALARQHGLHLAARQVFENQTLAALARVAEPGPRARKDDGTAAGPVPLTPIQQGYLVPELVEPEHFNQTLLLEVAPETPRIAGAPLRRALALLLEHHDALRMRFDPPASPGLGWSQRQAPPGGEPPLVEVDLSALPPARRSPALEAAAGLVQRSLDLSAGPLLRAAVFHLGPGTPDRFLAAAHHLVVDGVSWRILLADLEDLYRRLSRGEPCTLPARTTSFRRWAERLVEHARSPEAGSQAELWLRWERLRVPPLPVDRVTGENTVASAAAVRVELEPEETRRLLQEVPRAYRSQINDILVTALVEAFAGWTGDRRLWLELEGHGREDVFPELDVSRTVGWFTSIFPVLLDLEGAAGPGEALKAVKEQLRAVPERGFAYLPVRSAGEEGLRARLAALPRPELLFNYLGQLDPAVAEGRLFRLARESSGPSRSAAHRRSHLIEVNGHVAGGRLAMIWSYSEHRHRRATMEDVAGRFLAALRNLIDHCTTPGAGGFTPADFPLARIDQPTLDALVSAAGGRVEDLYPATPMQQGLLFHDLLAPHSGAHLGQLRLRFRGAIDPEAFERAWARVFARHAVLRTGFFGLDAERTLQVVHSEVPVTLEVLDWREDPPAEQRRRLAGHLEERLRRGFDAARPPLVHLALIRCGHEDWQFLWLHHHAILDGWSLPIVLRELLSFYEADLRAAETSLEPPPSFREYIAWLSRQDLAAAESFWRRELAGLVPVPLDGDAEVEADAGEAPVFGSVTGELPAAAADALRALARSRQLTLNTLVQGAWALLLRTFGGGGDVVFGVVTSGRFAPVEGIGEMVGLFINTLPARIVLEPADELVPWLHRIQEKQAVQRQLEHSPLVQVQAWSGVSREVPLFESLLAFENFPVDEAIRTRAGETLGISEVEAFEQSSYPLALVVSPGLSLGIKITHDPRRFGKARAGRMLRHLEALLAGMVSSPEARLGELPALTAAEREQLLWRGVPPAPGGEWETLPARAAALAQRTPEAVAAVLGDCALTYGELERQASGLARHLLARGAGPGSRVGLAVERSFDLLAGLLGIWKAGAVYVPLDPGDPADRLLWMVRDAGLRLLVTHGSIAAGLPLAGVERVVIDSGFLAGAAGDPADGPARIVSPDQPAYVIYTSGSTGRPKGVVVTHRGLPGLAESQSRLFAVGPGSRVLQLASPCFDASVSEVAMALWTGATLVLAPRETLLPGPRLVRLLEEHEVTAVTFTPSVLAALPEAGLPALTTLVVAGESCPAALAGRWSAGRRLINAYGPTETTVCATAGIWEGGAFLPLGHPLAGLEVCLLDAWDRLVPPGVAGELCVAGPGLAQGYLGLPGTTAGRFVPHPFTGEPGERLYRTGDLARHDATGALQYLGRIDRQVKVRGVRVEPGEVEAALRAHPAIADAAVVPREGSGAMALDAFVVVREPVEPGDLRAFLRERLPETFVPARYTPLAALPLSSRGKVDRRALAAASAMSEARMDCGSAAPRTPVEEVLAAIFAEILQRDHVGVRDDFFALGGHSLLATQVVTRVREALGLELPLRRLFDAPTVERLARDVEKARTAAAPDEERAPALAAAAIAVNGGVLRIVQQRLAPSASGEPDGTLAMRLSGELSVEALERTFEDLLRRRGAPATEAARPELAVFDLSDAPEEAREDWARQLALAETEHPADLGCGPQLSLSLLRLDAREHLLLVTSHPRTSGAWSAGELLRELETLYPVLAGSGATRPFDRGE